MWTSYWTTLLHVANRYSYVDVQENIVPEVSYPPVEWSTTPPPTSELTLVVEAQEIGTHNEQATSSSLPSPMFISTGYPHREHQPPDRLVDKL